MLDIVAAIFATAYCAMQAGLLIGPAPLRAGSKIALFAVTRLLRYHQDTQRICADDPSASVCGR